TMPFLDGVELSFQVKEAIPDMKILMLTVNDQGDRIRDAFKAGISGYVMKKADKKELENAIKVDKIISYQSQTTHCNYTK
ncbi:MAG: response regulator, partial [Pseudomonadota bacterium]